MIWWLRKQLLRIQLYVTENFQNEAESLIIWYAVCYALGAAFYLSLPWELPIWMIIVYFEAVLILLYLTRQKYGAFKFWSYVLVFLIGLSIAKADAIYHQRKVEDKIPEMSYLFGKIENIDKNYNNRTRLLLTDVNDFEHELKGKYRISVNQNPAWLRNGKCVELVAQMPKDYALNPLSNYNTQRANFYQEISGTGYTISPMFEKDCEQENSRLSHIIQTIRDTIKKTALEYTKPDVAAIITALTIGDKSEISAEQNADYRTAGLAHLLAISGMHIGLIALFVLFLIRVLLLPFGNGRYDWRKPAAICSFIAALGYFLISGQSISCRRAFIMTSLLLIAVLINRRAISLRLWAFALIVVTTVAPSAVLNAGFLMSFAAVLGITSFYERYREDIILWWSKRHWYGRVGAYFLGVLLTDLVASLMTMPYSIYYFHQVSLYTSLANLLAAPVIAFWVMPALLLFLICLPFGYGATAIIPLAKGVEIINNIATWVSSLAGAQGGANLSPMPEWSIAAISFGLLWLCIWEAKWRRLGLVIILVGFLGFLSAPQVDFVFDKEGTTFACRGENNKMLSTPWHENRFLAKVWAEEKSSSDKNLVCNKENCICHQEIEFKKGEVKYKGKPISLHNGGFIDIRRGIYYKDTSNNRIWDKK